MVDCHSFSLLKRLLWVVEWLSEGLMSRCSIDHSGDGFYRSDDPTNSVKAPKKASQSEDQTSILPEPSHHVTMTVPRGIIISHVETHTTTAYPLGESSDSSSGSDNNVTRLLNPSTHLITPSASQYLSTSTPNLCKWTYLLFGHFSTVLC